MLRKLHPCLLVVAAGMVMALFVAAAPRKGGVKYALLIGVRDYLPGQLRNLPYADNDIIDLAKVLIEQGGYRKEHVVVMTQKTALDKRKPQLNPLAANIRQQLKNILEMCEEQDSVLIAFAGHGIQFKGQKDNFFCPADAKLSAKETLISLSEVYRSLSDESKCKARFKLLLADACRNQPQTAVARARDEVDLENAPRPELEGHPEGVMAFFSCSAGKKAFEHDDIKHGVFFHFVIKGLQGGAADDKGVVTLGALEEYVKLEVKTFTRDKLDEVQRPDLVGQSNVAKSEWELMRSLAPAIAVAPFDAEKAKALQRAWAKHLGRKVVEEVDLGGGVTMDLVLIPPGKFKMGSPKDEKDRYDNEDQHEVEITKAFYLSKYEVTQEQYEQIIGKNPSWFSADGGGKETVKDLDTRRFPVEQLSWDDAVAFCRKLTDRDEKRRFRLPSEAEWEYACRAGTATVFHFGGVLNGDKANCDGNYPYGTEAKGRNLEKTCRVGSYAANAFGLHDMHGNVWEWCQDYYGPYKNLSIKDLLRTEKVEEDARVLRGGSWGLNAGDCRAASRRWYAPGYRYSYFGFRVAFRLD